MVGATSNYVEVTGVAAVLGVRDLKIEVDGETATGEAYLQAEVFVTGWFDDPEHGVVPGFENLSGVVVWVPMVFALDGMDVYWAGAESDGQAFLPPIRFSEDVEALQSVLWKLETVPTVASQQDDWSLAHEAMDDEDLVVDIGSGREARLSLNWSPGDEWTLTASVDNETLWVHCEFDDSVWVGGSGGMAMEPPWVLTAGMGRNDR